MGTFCRFVYLTVHLALVADLVFGFLHEHKADLDVTSYVNEVHKMFRRSCLR